MCIRDSLNIGLRLRSKRVHDARANRLAGIAGSNRMRRYVIIAQQPGVDGCVVLPVPLDAGHLADALPVLVVFLVWRLSVQSPDTDRGCDGDRDGDPVCAPATWAEFLHRQLDRVSGDSSFDDHRQDQPIRQQYSDSRLGL